MAHPTQNTSLSTLSERLRDVIVVTVTPLNAELNIDFVALERHLQFLTDDGLGVLTVNGNTGEFYALTVDEAKSVVECAAGLRSGGTTLIAGVGHDLETAIDLARHAESKGFDAVMVHHPSNPYVGASGFLDYVAAIADAVDVGVVPYIKSAHFDDPTVVKIAQIPNVVAIKYAVNDILKVSTLIEATPSAADVTWACGTAEAWAPQYFAAGATAFTSGLANVAPKLAIAMREALTSGDAAAVRRIWTEVKPFEALRAEKGGAANVTVVKDAMHRLGLGPRYVRPPAGTLTEPELALLDKILSGWKERGFA